MRLPFPDHISLVAVCFFAGTLCVIQLLQGTNPTFSLFAAAYILVAAIAFNVGGGLSRTIGAFVFFNSVLGVIVGLCMKAYLGEPADSNLQAPLLTMAVYFAGMCMMLVAAFVSRKISRKRAILGKVVTDANLQTATVGSMATGFLIFFAGFFIGGGNGTVWSALNQINRFFPLAVMMGVLHTNRRSGGTSFSTLQGLPAPDLRHCFHRIRHLLLSGPLLPIWKNLQGGRLTLQLRRHTLSLVKPG